MKELNKKNAFTVMELLVVITVLIIIVIGATNVNFNTSTNRQRLEIFTNKIISEIETVRTDDLVGRAELEGSDLTIPKKWKIEFSTSGSGSMITKSINPNNDNVRSLNIEEGYSIDELGCTHPTSGPYNEPDNATIIFEKGKYSLEGVGCQGGHNLITIKTSFNGIKREISFDTINGLITK